jgi:hypothetical protein
MYRRVLHDELAFESDSRMMDPDTKSFLRGLLQKDPTLRIGDARVKKHKYFEMIDFTFVYYKRYIPPYIPTLNPDDEADTSNFDAVFLEMEPELDKPEQGEALAAAAGTGAAEDEKVDETSGSADERADKDRQTIPLAATDENGQDVFDGYSFKGRDVDESIMEYDEEEEDDYDASSVSGRRVPDEVMDEEEEEDAGVTTSSMQTASTRPTSDGTGNVGSPNAPATDAAGRRRHARRSAELASLMETDGSSQAAGGASGGAGGVVGGEGAGEDDSSAVDDDFDDWDMVETPGGDAAEERNGRKANTLWARGVRDRYKLQLLPVAVRGVTSSRPSNKRQASAPFIGAKFAAFSAAATPIASSPGGGWDWTESRVSSRSSVTPAHSGSESTESPPPKLFSRRSALLRSRSDGGSKMGNSPGETAAASSSLNSRVMSGIARTPSPPAAGRLVPLSEQVSGGGDEQQQQRQRKLLKKQDARSAGVLSEDEDGLRGTKSKKGSKIKRLTFQGPLSVFQGR